MPLIVKVLTWILEVDVEMEEILQDELFIAFIWQPGGTFENFVWDGGVVVLLSW